jgi:hypothetical protein
LLHGTFLRALTECPRNVEGPIRTMLDVTVE